jgi:hypothetical protein
MSCNPLNAALAMRSGFSSQDESMTYVFQVLLIPRLEAALLVTGDKADTKYYWAKACEIQFYLFLGC